MEGYISVKEAAKLTGYTTAHITDRIRKGYIKAYRRGRKYLIKKEDLPDIKEVIPTDDRIILA